MTKPKNKDQDEQSSGKKMQGDEDMTLEELSRKKDEQQPSGLDALSDEEYRDLVRRASRGMNELFPSSKPEEDEKD